MEREELSFVIFCIENIAEKLNMTGEQAYDLLARQSNALNGYVLPCYDVLHTQGKEYVVNDIIEFLNKSGVAV